MKLKNIAVLLTALDSDAQAEILSGIEQYGKENGCNIAVFMWFTGMYEREKENMGEVNICRLPDLNLFDGVILLANVFHIAVNRSLIEGILENVTCPIVTIGYKYKDAPYVCADNYSGMREMVEYLVKERGMTRLHFVKGIEGNKDADDRYRAFVEVLAEHNIPLLPERVSKGDFYVTGGESAAREILSSSLPFPEAIVCANDTMALTICDILTEKGYRVPADVVITGYDYSLEGRMHFPKITSVDIDSHSLGENAVKTVLEMIAGNAVEKEITVPGKVIYEGNAVLTSVTGQSGWEERAKEMSKAQINLSDIIQRKMVHYVTMMEKEIMESGSFDGWNAAVREFIEVLGPAEFYCCVNQRFVEEVFEKAVVDQEEMSVEERLAYTEEVEVLIAYKNGMFREKSPFLSRCAFDELFMDAEKGKTFFFSPLHYLERNFGYLIFVDSRFPVRNPLYISWLIYMGHSVENIRKQNMLRNAMERLDDMYIKDSLTGAYNRFGMERFFVDIRRKCLMSGGYLQMSFVDVDGLKDINDTYGHEEGDRIINAVASLLKNESGKYYVIRFGGDEFVVMGVAASEEEVKAYWKRVEAAVDRYNGEKSHRARMSFSIGYDLIRPDAGTCLEDCIRVADKKMYAEKNRKKAMGGTKQ